MSATVYSPPRRTPARPRIRGRAPQARRGHAVSGCRRLAAPFRPVLPTSEGGRKRVALDPVLLEEHPLMDPRTTESVLGEVPGSLADVQEDRARLSDRRAIVELERRHPPVGIASENVPAHASALGRDRR